MAQVPTVVRGFLERVGLAPPPYEGGSPSDDAAPPVENAVLSRDPSIWLNSAWMGAIKANDDAILARDGGQDFALFDRLLDDDVAMSNMQQRRLAILARDWEVTPGDDKDPRSVQAAQDFKDMLDGVGFDRVTDRLHFAVWYGYAVAEAIWTTKVVNGRRIIWLSEVVVPDRRWFAYTFGGELRLATMFGTFGGEELPPNKFMSIRTGASHDFAFYGLGLAHWAYWPIWFKRSVVRFWALFLEKLADPTRVVEFEEGMSDTEKNKLLSAALAIGSDSAVAVPKGAAETLKMMEATRSVGGAPYRDFVTEQNEALMRIILGQPGTSKATPQGVGGTQAEVHADVKHEIVKADSDLICGALNNTFAKWVTRWNYGEDVKPPKVYRCLDDSEDLNKVAERDTSLDKLGWQRTDDSFTQTYGEGYEHKPKPEVKIDPLTGLPYDKPVAPPNGQPNPPANENDPAALRAAQARKRAEFDAQDPRPLYVQRRLQNVGEVTKWAKAQGFKDIASDMHVTIVYSRNPVDWFAMGEAWNSDKNGGLTVPPGGPRTVEKFGEGAVVLRFASSDLSWRHNAMVEKGASHDFDEYAPHITISYDDGGDGDVDLSKVEPYQGELVFGPELFEEIEPSDQLPGLTSFSAAEEEAIDELTSRLMKDSNPIFTEFAASIRDELAKAKDAGAGHLSLEGARVAILQAFERFDARTLAKELGLAFLAERAAAEVGAEDEVR